MKSLFWQTIRKLFPTLGIVMGVVLSSTAFGQGAPPLDSVNPVAADPGTENLLVTFTLSTTIPVPPDEVSPTGATLGSITGASVTRVDTYTVTAIFSIADDATEETVNATVTFPGPNGDVVFTLANGFSIGEENNSEEPNGLVLRTADSFEGYTLLAPSGQSKAYLLNHDGTVVHSWTCSAAPALATYLLDDGTLLRTLRVSNPDSPFTNGGGGIEILAKDSTVIWEYQLTTATQCMHHDIEMLPNGNILAIAYELKTETETIAAGRDPGALADAELWVDSVVEIEPTGASGGTIVWEWHAWDHLVQDIDPAKDNYGVVADAPGRIDINFSLQDQADWTHANGLDYNAELDQIIISVRSFSEFWVIDHSTSTAEAASSSGGTSGQGGDLLYRWGNPQTYGRGDTADQQLFVQHDAQWIESGLPGEDNILVFNNGQGRPEGNASSIDEIVPPVQPDGSYSLATDAAYGPAAATWTYAADTPSDFYADHISGTQRLPNGNTLICAGTEGRIFEVTAAGDIVWDYVNPYTSTTPNGDSNAVFRAYRYGTDSAAVTALNPENTIDARSTGTTYTIVDTGQVTHYSDTTEIPAPAPEEAFYGQDAQCVGNQPNYEISADGLTVYDHNTGLTWTRSHDLSGDGLLNADDKLSQSEAVTHATVLNSASYGGYSDWRLPSIKELYSLMDFRGTDPDPIATDTSDLTPFIDTDYFEIGYGDTSAGQRIIDSQFATTTIYVDTVMNGQEAMFGLNLVDGRIKGYPTSGSYYVYYCRGNPAYGINEFSDNEDGTVTDSATGLMWAQADSGTGMDWSSALAYAEDADLAGYTDWRLPNTKELQSLIDYTRSPGTTASAAIDPLFTATQITNMAGQTDYPWYWSGTTHMKYTGDASAGSYVCFGRGTGTMDEGVTIIDVHGAGCQRSDPKSGDAADYPSSGHGPQGDVRRVFNYVRLVRSVTTDPVANLAPEADAGGPYTGTEGQAISLDGSGSSDTDGSIVSYEWDLDNDGQYDDATGDTASHTWDTPGTYTIGLKVTDDDGATDADTATVSVAAAPPEDDWVVKLIGSNTAVDLLEFGINPDATEGLDSEHDSLAPPPSFGDGATIALLLPVNDTSLTRDIRGSLSGSVWRVLIDGASATVDGTIEVDGTTLPEESLYIWQLDAADGDPVAGTQALLTGATVIPMDAGEDSWYAIAAEPPPEVLIDDLTPTIPEGGTATVRVKLSRAPDTDVTVTGAATGGDSDVIVAAGSQAAFSTGNWNTYQPITIQAAEDADTTGGNTTLTLVGEGLFPAAATVTEIDDDVTLTMAVDGDGSTTPAVGEHLVDVNDDLPLTIGATPGSGQDFTGWSGTGTVSFADSADASTTATLSSDTTITAHFIAELAVESATPGTVSGTGTPAASVTDEAGVAEGADLIFTVQAQGGQVEYSYAWTVNGEAAGADSATLTYSPDYNTVPHPARQNAPIDVVCVITDSRGGPSAIVTWDNVVVTDTDRDPSAPTLSISPATPATGDDLTVTVVTPAVDPDGDALQGYSYLWSGPSASREVLETNTISSSLTAKGQTWQVTVTPQTDPYAEGPVAGTNVAESSVSVGNTAPTVQDQQLLATKVDIPLAIQLSATDSDVDDGVDTLAYGIASYPSTREGDFLSALDTTAGTLAYTPALYEGMDSFDFTAIDGDETSAPATVDILVYDGWLLNVITDRGENVQFGVTSSATLHIDEGIDVEATLESLAFLFAPSAQTGGLLRDMRPETTGSEWLLSIIAGNGDVRLSWTTSDVPNEGLTMRQFSLENNADIPGTEIDMAVVDEQVVAAGTTMVLKISAPSVGYDLELIPGWNLISLPIQPEDPTISAILHPDNVTRLDGKEGTVYFGGRWQWDPALNNGHGQYVKTTELSACEGCWIYVAVPVNIHINGVSEANTVTSFVPGWNLIGVAEEKILEETPGLFLPGWGWDAEANAYTPFRSGDTMQPGRACWFFATEAGEL